MSEPVGMDREANNARLRHLVERRRPGKDWGPIPAGSIAPMVNDLTALLDEQIDAAYTAGLEDAQ